MHPNKKKYPIGSAWQQRDGGLCIVTGHYFNTNNQPFSVALRFKDSTKSADDYFTFFENGRYIDGDHPEDLVKIVSLDPSARVMRGGGKPRKTRRA